MPNKMAPKWEGKGSEGLIDMIRWKGLPHDELEKVEWMDET